MSGGRARWFELGGADYARFRPDYPAALAGVLAGYAPQRALAVDVGCGSGQLTVALARGFGCVIGVDPSAEQVAHAAAGARVFYVRGAAEGLPLRDGAAGLIAAAQAAHWFDQAVFHAEVRRVLVPGGVVALVSYGLTEADGAVGEVLRRFYGGVIGGFWPAERMHVETGYRLLPFPFAALEAPALAMARVWRLDELLGYVGTWSAVRRALAALGEAPMAAFGGALAEVWGDPGRGREIRWPVSMRVGRV